MPTKLKPLKDLSFSDDHQVLTLTQTKTWRIERCWYLCMLEADAIRDGESCYFVGWTELPELPEE